MRVGRLTDRVTHQTATTTTDEWGEEQEVWSDNRTVGMDVTPETADERIRAGRVEASQGARFRYRGGIEIEPDDRLVWKGASWLVKGWPVQVRDRPPYYQVWATRVE